MSQPCATCAHWSDHGNGWGLCALLRDLAAELRQRREPWFSLHGEAAPHLSEAGFGCRRWQAREG